jgi:hypothetical protein
MYDVNELLEPAGIIAPVLWIERGDGLRQRLSVAADLDTAKREMTRWLSYWKNQGTKRTVHRVDSLSATLTYNGMREAVVYIEPFPERPAHDGDLRVQRSRKPIP